MKCTLLFLTFDAMAWREKEEKINVGPHLFPCKAFFSLFMPSNTLTHVLYIVQFILLFPKLNTKLYSIVLPRRVFQDSNTRTHREKKDTSHTGILSTPISESPLQRQSMITVSMCFRCCCCCCWFVCFSVVRKIEFKYLRLHINGKKFCWFNPRQQFGWHTKKREEEMKNAWLTSTHVWIARQINQPNEKFVDNIYDFIGSDVTLFFFVTPGEWLLNGS